ncbi:hypothetical protein FACS1894202_07600 [Clostridia bacterium]|nr:hypothetical protein FACS1894202_07600 [Clostridia bacterium]
MNKTSKPIAPNKTVSIALISPSDVAEERKAVEAVVRNLSSTTARYGLTFVINKWEDVAPVLRMRSGQYDIDKHIEDSEIYIAIFYSRVGRQFGGELSGSIHEINSAVLRYKRLKHRDNAPEIMLFFKEDKRPLGSLSIEETNAAKAVKETRQEYQNLGLVGDFADSKDLSEKIHTYLWTYFLKFLDVYKGGVEISELLFADLAAEKILAYLEMDNGYSEKIVELFNSFRHTNHIFHAPPPYYTNFVFDTRRLLKKSHSVLYERFKNLMVVSVCDKLALMYDEIPALKKGRKIAIIGAHNFSEYAGIMFFENGGYANLLNPDTIYNKYENELIHDLAECMGVQIDKNLESISPPLSIDRRVCVVFATVVTQRLLERIERALATLPNQHIMLFSVIESPGKGELYDSFGNISYPIDDGNANNCRMAYPNLCAAVMSRTLHYRSFFERNLLEKDGSIVMKQLHNEEESDNG